MATRAVLAERSSRKKPHRKPFWLLKVPRDPVQRVGFLLERARHRLVRQADLDLFLVADRGLPNTSKKMLMQWRETLDLLVKHDIRLLLMKTGNLLRAIEQQASKAS